MECLKIKTSILTSQDLALRPRQILPLENAMRVSAPQVIVNSIFILLTQDLIITITQASVFQAALPVTRLMIVTGILIFLSLLLGQMIISFPLSLSPDNNLLLLGLGNTTKQSAAC